MERTERDRILERLDEGFMVPIVEHGTWIQLDGPMGGEHIPGDLYSGSIELDADGTIPEGLRDYCENRKAYSIERVIGWGARLSAPGYMDCTDWSVFDTEDAALDFLAETYGDDLEEEEEEEEESGAL